MTIANNIIALALRTSGVLGIGQTAQTQDTQDAFTLLNDQIDQWNAARVVAVIPGVLDRFPDFTTDVPSWTHNENVLVWNLSVRLRTAFGLPEDEQQTKIAMLATQILQANNLQQQPPDAFATVDTTGYGLVALALRAAGRVTDAQGILTTSQDASDGVLLLREMLDEWQLDRTVTVTPGTFPVIGNPTATITVTTGLKSAIVWNLAVRMRAAFGADESKNQNDLAAKSLAALQANNKQQQAAPAIAATDNTGYGLVFLALRASGRITDDQSVTQGSQDVSDAASLMQEMLDEWLLARIVTVTPDTLPAIGSLTATLSLPVGYKNAIVLNLASRLREAFGLEENKAQFERAARALSLIQANNKQQQAAPAIAATDNTGYGLVFLALRASGRITDDQSVTQGSQDVSDVTLLMQEMLDEWRLERTVTVTPGTLPAIADMTAQLSLLPGYKNAIVLNLACRVRESFGLEENKTQVERASRALSLIQANNKQQQPAPSIAATDNTGYGLVFLALRASGRIDDQQSVTQGSQDVSDVALLMQEMLDEWQLERLVTVTPGALPAIADMTTQLSLLPGYKNAIVLNLACRVRESFGLEENKSQLERAARALALIQANNKQQQPAQSIAANDNTGYGLLFLALRAAGRVTDAQGILTTSQDITDAASIMQEMLDEWTLARTVTVTPGVLPTISNLTILLMLPAGYKNAIVLNLACRLREAFGLDENKPQMERAAQALALVQANNKQQQPAVHSDGSTVMGVIFLALRMAGRVTDAQGVADGSQDVSDALMQLNMMLAQWSKERWLVYDLKDVAKLSTGAASYSIGLGGDIDCPRPDRLESAFVRMGPLGAVSLISGDFAPADFSSDFYIGSSSLPAIDPTKGLDYPLQILPSREDYNQIRYKGLTSFPSAVFLDSDYPLGRVYVYPTPIAQQYEIHLSIKATFPEYVTAQTTLGLPPEYRDALVTNLACRLTSLVGGNPTQYMLGMARASLKTIRAANLQISTLSMPSGLPGFTGAYASRSGLGGAVYNSNVGLIDSNNNHLIAG